MESDDDEKNDDFDNENDAYQARLDTQRRDRIARSQRHNDPRQDEDTDNDASTSTTNTVQPKRRMVD